VADAEKVELTDAEWRRRCAAMIEKEPVTPGRGQVLVARQPRLSKTGGGVIIPEKGQEQSQVGLVIALGPEGRNLMGSANEYWLKPGDTVLVNQYAGKPLLLRDVEMAIFVEDDVVGRINPTD
jgi:chaperonin GroES